MTGACVTNPAGGRACLRAPCRSGPRSAREWLRWRIARNPRGTDDAGASWHQDANTPGGSPEGGCPGHCHRDRPGERWDPDGRGGSAHRGTPAVDRTDPQDRPGGDAGLVENALTDPELADDLIAAAMAKAEARVYVGSDRCYALLSDIETARTRCTAGGRCRVGLIVSKGGRESFDVCLEVSTGLVKLVRQAEA